MSQQIVRNNRSSDSSDSSDSTDSSSVSSSISAAQQIVRTFAGTPATWSPLRVPSEQDLVYSPTRNIDSEIAAYRISESESQSEQVQESEQDSEIQVASSSYTEQQPAFPSFMTGLVIMVSIIMGMELPSRPVTATLLGIVGLIYNYRRVIGTTNMRILAGVGIYAMCAAIWLMFEWQYQLQITPILANKTNMFYKFVTTHIQHIVLWPLTITINFMRRSAYPFLSVIGTNISNFYTTL